MPLSPGELWALPWRHSAGGEQTPERTGSPAGHSPGQPHHAFDEPDLRRRAVFFPCRAHPHADRRGRAVDQQQPRDAQGLIRVNASLGFGRRYIGPALGAFFAQYPEVEIQLEISDHPLDLATHGFDLGIRFGILPDAAFHARKIALEDQTPTRADVYAVYPQQLHLSARVRSLFDFLAERFKHIDHLEEQE